VLQIKVISTEKNKHERKIMKERNNKEVENKIILVTGQAKKIRHDHLDLIINGSNHLNLEKH